MKKLLLSTALVLAPVAALADGLETAPAAPAPMIVESDMSWTGFYAGASGNLAFGDETTMVDTRNTRGRSHPRFTTVTDSFDDAGLGAFLGYRHDFGNVVTGAELGIMAFDDMGTVTTAELQLGIDAGNLFPYISVGQAWTDGDDTTTYGLGADYRFDNGVFVGAAYDQMDFGSTDADVFSLRLGLNF